MVEGIRVSLRSELRVSLVWVLGHVLIVYLLILAIGLFESSLHQIPLLLGWQAQLGLNDAAALGRDEIRGRVVPQPQRALILAYKQFVGGLWVNSLELNSLLMIGRRIILCDGDS